MSFSQWLDSQKMDHETLPIFALRLGIPYTTLYYIIKHNQEPETRTIRTIAKGLDLPIETVWKALE